MVVAGAKVFEHDRSGIGIVAFDRGEAPHEWRRFEGRCDEPVELRFAGVATLRSVQGQVDDQVVGKIGRRAGGVARGHEDEPRDGGLHLEIDAQVRDSAIA